MKKSKIKESKAGTFFVKNRWIPKGCQQCLNGSKAVLFLNGICQNPKHCYWYCPISEERKGKNLTYANEILIETKDELLEELITINATGMSITGGDPLLPQNLEAVLDYIRFVKEKMEKKFHIHLYTNGLNFDEKIAFMLSQAGLDEIRFNPSEDNWGIIQSALNKGMKVGAEVPLIPDKAYLNKLAENIRYLDRIGGDFVNLNEFEYCVSNSRYLKERGFQLKEKSLASVVNSKEMGIELIENISSEVNLKIHFCTVVAKDYWQLKERYYRRAKKVKMEYEEVTDEGLLLFAQIESNPPALKVVFEYLLNQLNVPRKYLYFDKKIIKLPTSIAISDEFLKVLSKYKLNGFIVETTPFKRELYRQITEKTPIKVFIDEFELSGN